MTVKNSGKVAKPTSDNKTESVAKNSTTVENTQNTTKRSRSSKISSATTVAPVATPATTTTKTPRSTKKSTNVAPVTTTQSTESAPVQVTPVPASGSESNEMKFTSRLADFQSLLSETRGKFNELNGFLKKLESSYKQDVKRVSNKKQRRTPPANPTGFIKQTAVPARLASFIGVEAGTALSGPEITSKVWDQMKARNLVYANDKRVLRTNEEVTALFGVPASVNESTSFNDENGFNFCNIQKYIARVLNAQDAPVIEKIETVPVKREKKTRTSSNSN